MIRREGREKSQTRPRHIERTVSIEQALPAVAADDGTETEIAIAGLLLGRAARRQRAGFERRLGNWRLQSTMGFRSIMNLVIWSFGHLVIVV